MDILGTSLLSLTVSSLLPISRPLSLSNLFAARMRLFELKLPTLRSLLECLPRAAPSRLVVPYFAFVSPSRPLPTRRRISFQEQAHPVKFEGSGSFCEFQKVCIFVFRKKRRVDRWIFSYERGDNRI